MRFFCCTIIIWIGVMLSLAGSHIGDHCYQHKFPSWCFTGEEKEAGVSFYLTYFAAVAAPFLTGFFSACFVFTDGENKNK